MEEVKLNNKKRTVLGVLIVVCILALMIIPNVNRQLDAKKKAVDPAINLRIEMSEIIGAFGDTVEMDRFLVCKFGSVEEGKKQVSILHIFNGPAKYEVYYVIRRDRKS